MIVRVLSLGSCWRDADDRRPFVWNTSGVSDLRVISPRSKVPGQVRFNARLLQEAIGTTGLRGSTWHASPVSERLGFRGLALERRASQSTSAEWWLVSVTDRLSGKLDDASWDPDKVQLISLSQWKGAQEAIFLARRNAWLRGTSGAAVFTPNAPGGDWAVRNW
jgi:hypothetical protein